MNFPALLRAPSCSHCVPTEGGLTKDKVKDREMYRKRQAAGGGVTSENIAVQERDWNVTVASLFVRRRH